MRSLRSTSGLPRGVATKTNLTRHSLAIPDGASSCATRYSPIQELVYDSNCTKFRRFKLLHSNWGLLESILEVIKSCLLQSDQSAVFADRLDLA